MATAMERVKEKYPNATPRRYKTHGGISYYLLWSNGIERGVRLSEGKTAAAAWSAAAKKISAKAAQ
ncbi:MAG: hypothetical protein JO253_03355 [Alphaproteobacteria bacterium]|nr:hypothetical protein [Alphaproteobacteria bacterium]